MIKVLHVVYSMGLGGLETFIMNLYNTIDGQEIKFDFLVHTNEEAYYNEEIRKKGGNIFPINSRRNGFFNYIKELKKFFIKNKCEYNAIHIHLDSASNISPAIVAKKSGCKNILIHAHSTSIGKGFYHKILHRINRLRIKRYSDYYLACSESAGQWLFNDKKYLLINNGINSLKYIYNIKDRDIIRKKFCVGNCILIGHVGRFDLPKNHKRIIDIFIEFNEHNQNSKLILIGDGPLRMKIEEYVKSKYYSEKIIFAGVQKNIGSYLSAIDLILMPSLYEGLPVSLVEAQASGLICVVSDVITKEVNITNLVKFVNLEKPNNYWSRIISENLSSNYNRIGYNTIIRESDYEIVNSIKPLLEIYHHYE